MQRLLLLLLQLMSASLKSLIAHQEEICFCHKSSLLSFCCFLYNVTHMQRLVEAAEEAHLQHEENPDLQVRAFVHLYSKFCSIIWNDFRTMDSSLFRNKAVQKPNRSFNGKALHISCRNLVALLYANFLYMTSSLVLEVNYLYIYIYVLESPPLSPASAL